MEPFIIFSLNGPSELLGIFPLIPSPFTSVVSTSIPLLITVLPAASGIIVTALKVPAPAPKPVTIAGPDRVTEVPLVGAEVAVSARPVTVPFTYMVLPSGITAKHSKLPDTFPSLSFAALKLKRVGTSPGKIPWPDPETLC